MNGGALRYLEMCCGHDRGSGIPQDDGTGFALGMPIFRTKLSRCHNYFFSQSVRATGRSEALLDFGLLHSFEMEIALRCSVNAEGSPA